MNWKQKFATAVTIFLLAIAAWKVMYFAYDFFDERWVGATWGVTVCGYIGHYIGGFVGKNLWRLK